MTMSSKHSYSPGLSLHSMAAQSDGRQHLISSTTYFLKYIRPIIWSFIFSWDYQSYSRRGVFPYSEPKPTRQGNKYSYSPAFRVNSWQFPSTKTEVQWYSQYHTNLILKMIESVEDFMTSRIQPSALI